MWHPLLSLVCTATVFLCLPWAASSHANGTGLGGQAFAVCPGPPLTEGKMAGGATLGHVHTASMALSPPCGSAKAASAQQCGHKVTTNSPGFGDTAPGDGEITGGSTVTVMDVNMKLWRQCYGAERGTIALLDECCFWSDILWSFSHHICRCLTHVLDLLYHGLILLVCTVTGILLIVITGAQLLARCVKSYQSGSKAPWPGCPPSTVWVAANPPECVICLQAYKPGEGLKLLSCSHAYHGKCIDLWHCAQPGAKTCPLCLRSVTAVVLIPLTARNSKKD
ncbi:hypothetical protein AV530_016330 [Patagioenas fasciata monilis]|uniref:RING-type domain-containing protein n=1 Tax=Patagioenas fasciata monilis TaxID=372326 RepID=A0A1V4KWF7_PATFA|nr:hypothetical protein AV530_016330 [Patagioenas fasciata monilis]